MAFMSTPTRSPLPQLSDELFLTDGGIETSLIFDDGLDLPDFAAFGLLDSDAGRAALTTYFERYAEIARRHRTGLVLETPTWRASGDWIALQGHPLSDLPRLNAEAVSLVRDVADRYAGPETPVVVSGCIGPRFDGYAPERVMNPVEARDYHLGQARAFAESDADLVTAITMTSADEAIGVLLAAREVGMPAAISFTVETDGTLPDGTGLADSIARTDAESDGYAAYFMLNCAHPTHFSGLLGEAEPPADRVRGIRANASRRSHAELDEAEDLDAGDPLELAAQYAELRAANPGLTVLGGCCGTNEVHISAIAQALRPVEG